MVFINSFAYTGPEVPFGGVIVDRKLIRVADV
jgi:hypothetical protein